MIWSTVKLLNLCFQDGQCLLAACKVDKQDNESILLHVVFHYANSARTITFFRIDNLAVQQRRHSLDQRYATQILLAEAGYPVPPMKTDKRSDPGFFRWKTLNLLPLVALPSAFRYAYRIGTRERIPA